MKQNSDSDLWSKWNKSKTDANLTAVLRSLDGLIQRQVNIYSSAPVPRSAIEAEAKIWAVKAIKTFNPSLGFKLSTHVTNYMRKLYRYIGKHQNVARIPEHRIMKIKEYETASNYLHESLERQPNVKELAGHLKWKPNHVSDMQKSLRQDIAASGSLAQDSHSEYSREGEVMNMAYFSFTPEEKTVYDYTTGQHGKPRKTPGQIAVAMRVSPSKISKIRGSVANKLSGAIGGI